MVKIKNNQKSYYSKKRKNKTINNVLSAILVIISILTFAIIYIVSPLDLFPSDPIDDIAVGVLSIIGAIITLVLSLRTGRNTEDTLHAVEDKAHLSGAHILKAKNKMKKG